MGSPRLTPKEKSCMAQEAAELAKKAANGVPGAAEMSRAILHQLKADRRLTVGR